MRSANLVVSFEQLREELESAAEIVLRSLGGCAASPVSEDGDLSDSLTLVKYAYGDLFDLKTRSLSFKTEYLPAEQAAELVRLICRYNDFSGTEVANALLAVAKTWSEVGKTVTAAFGREASPVLYVQFPRYTSEYTKNAIDWGERLTESLSVLNKTDPSEFGDVNGLPDVDGVLRLWWD